MTFEDGNKVTFNNGTAYTVDYTLSEDGKTATFSTTPFEFECKLSEDGTTIAATLDDGDAPFPLTYTKQ
ncbi:MAG TPA: hypothetical protein DDY70_07290 [Clostridiales bacterium]|nr:hypothetical protein [Clostridiales bacterium]